MKKILLFALVTLAAAGCAPAGGLQKITLTQNYNYSHTLQIGGRTLMVEIAATPAAKALGLSGRSAMEQNQGMLFEFGKDSPAAPGFWMKNMQFNLDFIWISQNKIIGITADIAAPKADDENLPLYHPPSPVTWVLEVNSGWAEKNNTKVGDEVKLVN